MTTGSDRSHQDRQQRMQATKDVLKNMVGKKIIEDSIAFQAEMRYDGKSGGDKWKDKVGRMLIGKLPALYDIFRFAESEACQKEYLPEEGVTTAMVEVACGGMLTYAEVGSISNHLWNFLTNCL